MTPTLFEYHEIRRKKKIDGQEVNRDLAELLTEASRRGWEFVAAIPGYQGQGFSGALIRRPIDRINEKENADAT